MIYNYTYCNAECDATLIATPKPCAKVKIDFSQIQGVIIIPKAAPKPSDWTTREGWEGVIINDDATGNFGKYIPVRSALPVPEKVVISLPRSNRKIHKRDYTLIGELDGLSDVMYKALQSMQHRDYRNPSYSLWFETVSGWLYGGANGIQIESDNAELPLSPERSATVIGRLIFKFSSNADIERTRSKITIQDIQSRYWLYPDGTEWTYPDGEFWEYPDPTQ